MNKPITVKQLAEYCNREIAKGRGDYSIMLSSDDEGNSYHYLWYAFMTAKDYLKDFEDEGMSWGIDGLDKSIAPVEKTIILG